MSTLARDENNSVAQVGSPGASQDVAIGAASAASAAFGDSTTLCRLVATVDCRIAFGMAPVAAAGGTLLPAGVPEVFACTPGGKVAVIQQSGAGILNVTELR